MTFAFFCDKGLEKTICTSMGIKAEQTFAGCIIIHAQSLATNQKTSLADSAIHHYYTNQWATKILTWASYGSSLKDALDTWGIFNEPGTLAQNATFAIKVQGLSMPEEAIKQAAAYIGDKSSWSVNLSNPDVLIYIIQREDTIIIGVDLAQLDLFKREYRIYTNPSILRSTVAFGALLHAGYDPKKVLLDPFAGSGTIGIEAALFANTISPWMYKKNDFAIYKSGLCTKEEMIAAMKEIDAQGTKTKRDIYVYDHLLKRVQATTYNAKIAGVLDILNNSKIAIDWVDTKFDEQSVDCIVTQPPILTKETQKTLKKCYEELSGQLDYLLAAHGCALLIVRHPQMVLDALGDMNVRNTRTLEIHQGQEPLFLMKFEP